MGSLDLLVFYKDLTFTVTGGISLNPNNTLTTVAATNKKNDIEFTIIQKKTIAAAKMKLKYDFDEGGKGLLSTNLYSTCAAKRDQNI